MGNCTPCACRMCLAIGQACAVYDAGSLAGNSTSTSTTSQRQSQREGLSRWANHALWTMLIQHRRSVHRSLVFVLFSHAVSWALRLGVQTSVRLEGTLSLSGDEYICTSTFSPCGGHECACGGLARHSGPPCVVGVSVRDSSASLIRGGTQRHSSDEDQVRYLV